jgi:thiol-disulfide isomerase/thioredoxin
MHHIEYLPGANLGRRSLIGGAAATTAAALLSATTAGWAGPRDSDAFGGLPVEGMLPLLDGATAWLNSTPLTAMDLRGKVVLVNFWTLTCINWLRTLPYVRAWATKYRQQGLVVIGVHTPEFSFEQDIDNVRRAAKGLSLDYPIAVDSHYAVWRAFQNHYWPAVYLVDAQGRIRHHQFGEGDYEKSEHAIQQLLIEAGRDDVKSDLVSVEGAGVQAAADWASLKSPETYLGYALAERFASTGGIRKDAPNLYRTPSTPLHSWGVAGEWTVAEEFAALNKASGRITCRFHARDLHLIMAPSAPGRAIRFRIKLDGAAPGADHGGDVDAAGLGSVQEGRLYQLVRQTGTIGDRTFEIEFLDPDIRAFAFTFG